MTKRNIILNILPSANQIIAPHIISSINSNHAFRHINVAHHMTASEKWYAVNADASLNKLSPSRIVIVFLVSHNSFVIAIAATASVGESIAPRVNASGHDILGIRVCAITAITNAVIKTRDNDNTEIVERCLLNNGRDMFAAASYKIGGKKIKKIISGLS